MDDIPTTWTVRLSVWGRRTLTNRRSSVLRLVRRFILLFSIGIVLTLLLIPPMGLWSVVGMDWPNENGPVTVAIAQETSPPPTTEAPTPDPQPTPQSTVQPSPSPNAVQGQPTPESTSTQDSPDPSPRKNYVSKEDIIAKPTLEPVILDGQTVFEVAPYENLTAETRANQISLLLDVWADQKQLPDITIEEGRGTTSIVLTNSEGVASLLVTVTKADAVLDLRTPQAQAEEWVEKIREALAKAQSERKSLGRSIVLAIAAFAITCLMFWYLRQLQFKTSKHPLKQLKRLLQGKVNRDGIPIQVRQVAWALCLEFFRYGIWIALIFYITQLFPVTRQGSYDLTTTIFTTLTGQILPLGGEAYSIIDFLILMAGLLILVVGATLITNVLKTRILQLAGISTGAQQAIATLSRYTLIGLGAVVILQLWGLDLSSLTIIASALGVGIGFGLQNIARDFSSGLVLLFERPIQVGDFIEVGDFRGTVDRIGARSTMIKTLDQVSVIVPNSYFLDNQVVNWSHDNPLSRISIPVGVSYQANPEEVKSLLLQAGTAHKGVLQIPAPQVLFKGFGDNSLNFELLVWIVEPNRQPLIRSDLNFSVLGLLKDHGIEIPYPQRDLHIRTGSLPTSLVDPDGLSNPQLKQPQNLPTVQDNDSAL